MLDNCFRESENNSIPQDSTPEQIQRNTALPALNQTKMSPVNTSKNRNLKNTEINSELKRWSVDKKLESTSTTKRNPLCNLKNENNW